MIRVGIGVLAYEGNWPSCPLILSFWSGWFQGHSGVPLLSRPVGQCPWVGAAQLLAVWRNPQRSLARSIPDVLAADAGPSAATGTVFQVFISAAFVELVDFVHFMKFVHRIILMPLQPGQVQGSCVPVAAPLPVPLSPH